MIYILIGIILVVIFFLLYKNYKEKFTQDKNNVLKRASDFLTGFFYSINDNYKLNIHTVFLLKENIPFLREWIIYHINLGFDKIYLYDNTGSIGRNGSNQTTNKYNFNFDSIITLTDKQIEDEMRDIIKTFKNNIVYIKWQPKNDKGEIVYGYNYSVVDYIKRSKSNTTITTYTAFIDIDEFIFSPMGLDLKDYIINQSIDNVNKIIIKQKKFTDRFCNNKKRVIDIEDSIINIDTDDWGCKQIINNSALDIKNITNMHTIGITEGTTIKAYVDTLRFNHYNVNTKQIEWMKEYYNQQDFTFGKDDSLYKYNSTISKQCQDKCSDKTNMINMTSLPLQAKDLLSQSPKVIALTDTNLCIVPCKDALKQKTLF